MLPVKYNSPKSELKCSHLTRLTACPSTCSKALPNSVKKKDYERPQPVKIAQLIKQSKNLKSAQKSTGRKKILPERLGSTRSTKKDSRVSVSNQPTYTNNRVRRVLNFNEISANTLENNNETENQLKIKDKFVTNVLTHDKVSKPVKKKSLLVVPNSIKNKHLQGCNEKISRYSKISEVIKEIDETNTDRIIEKKNKIINESFGHGNEHKIVQSSNCLKSTSRALQPSSQCKTHQQVRVNNKDQLFIPNNVKSKTFIKSIKEDDYLQNLCNDLQNSKLMASANNTRVKRRLPEMICVNKDQIVQLECNLKELLEETEKNVIKLKSSLTFIANLLVINDQEVAHNINDDSEEENNTMIDKEVQVEICCKSFQCSSGEKFKTPIMNAPQITVQNTEQLNEHVLTRNDDDNKENVEDLNISSMSDTVTDGSFLELENQLNIMHTKPTENNSLQPKVPMVMRHKQKRSLREYMALKSNISFLLTPDTKKFRSLCQIDNTDKSMFSVKSISNKLLRDLHNLYSDSPDS